MATHIVDGVKVTVEGTGPHTVVMIHGWPDTHRLWDGTVQGLRNDFTCVRFTLPGFDLTQSPRPTSVAQMTALFDRIVDVVSPGKPVTLLLHDWGCMFGYEFAARHPAKVAQIVAVDIGDHNSPAYVRSLRAGEKFQILFYQMFLAICWKLGPISSTLADHMTRWMARQLRCRTPPQSIGWQMNYPYAMQWFRLLGGFAGIAQVEPRCPVFYVYGLRKPFMFQSPEWLEKLAAQPQNSVQGFLTGHWVMVHQPKEFVLCVKSWLQRSV